MFWRRGVRGWGLKERTEGGSYAWVLSWGFGLGIGMESGVDGFDAGLVKLGGVRTERVDV